ncbi:DUF1294 domain-containing protein [Peribacillus asahii]|uniref:DUF1294 domain-containing protein n=2 Tax=Peribacillus asahii TaxID=228899 RepID=A0A398BC56_9BACI|nr:DUF1294 domain-containing protein [Peribacillus asahii]RID86418.1 DUF1294 domain-containing protein [Peribacillus asahii]
MFIMVYMIFINILAFTIMGIDKKKARNGEYRISERTLWTVAVIGGGTGAYLGMKQFRHKTKHTSFKWGLPVLMVIQLGLLVTYGID